MAIEVLQGVPIHTYRHDLESFFYVLIWICVLYKPSGAAHYIEDIDKSGKTRRRRPLALDGWSSTYAAEVKYAKMYSKNQFESILNEFADGYSDLKDMVREIREVLFLPEGRERSYEDQKSLYDRFLAALQTQLDGMKD